MKIAHLLVLALALVVVAESITVPLHRVQRTPAQKRAYYERIRSGEAARAVAAKYQHYVRAKYPNHPAAFANPPADPFKNYDDVRQGQEADRSFPMLVRTNTRHVLRRFYGVATPVTCHYACLLDHLLTFRHFRYG